MNQYRYLIGCDPSYQNFGVCIYDTHQKTMLLKTGKFGEMVKFINSNIDKKKSIAVVENSALVSAVFKMWPMVKQEIDKYAESLAKYHMTKIKGDTLKPHKPTLTDVQSSFAIAMKLAQHVGNQKGACEQIIEIFKSVDIPVYEVSPAARDRADKAQKKAGKATVNIHSLTMPTKTTAAQFKELTGYGAAKGESSNEHNRDAATLIYGKTCEYFYKKIFNTPSIYPRSDNQTEKLPSPNEMEFYNDPDPTDLIKNDDIYFKNSE